MKTPWINFAFWLFYVHGEAVKLRFFIGQNFIESSEACCTLNWGLLPRHFRNSLRLWRSLLALPCTCEEFDQFDVIFHKPAPNFIWIDSSLMKHSFFFIPPLNLIKIARHLPFVLSWELSITLFGVRWKHPIAILKPVKTGVKVQLPNSMSTYETSTSISKIRRHAQHCPDFPPQPFSPIRASETLVDSKKSPERHSPQNERKTS